MISRLSKLQILSVLLSQNVYLHENMLVNYAKIKGKSDFSDSDHTVTHFLFSGMRCCSAVFIIDCWGNSEIRSWDVQESKSHLQAHHQKPGYPYDHTCRDMNNQASLFPRKRHILNIWSKPAHVEFSCAKQISKSIIVNGHNLCKTKLCVSVRRVGDVCPTSH